MTSFAVPAYQEIGRDVARRVASSPLAGRTIESLVSEAKEVLFDLIAAVHSDSSPSIERWRHRESVQAKSTPYLLYRELAAEGEKHSIMRAELRGAVGRYVRTPWMHTDFVDWLCADTLIFAEYVATARDLASRRFGFLAAIAMTVPTTIAGKLSVLSLRGLVSFVKWCAIVLLAVVLNGFFQGAGLAFAMLVILREVLRWRARWRMDHLIGAMARTYQCLSTTTPSWRALLAEMEDARKLGVVWDGELWRLVELKAKDA